MTKISVIVCTHNAPDLVKNCLNSILKQDYDDFEVICVDGMSEDNTQEVIKGFKNKVRLVINEKKLPEGKGYGKWLGYKAAKGDIIAFIDQDNVLQKDTLFSEVVSTFKTTPWIGGVLGGLKHDKRDDAVVRYISLVGTDSFFAYRSLDFVRRLCPQQLYTESHYILKNNMLLTGGNCFFYSKRALASVGGYDQDVLVMKRLAPIPIVVISDATKHYAEKSMWALAKKKFFWGTKYYEKDTERFDYLPRTTKEKISFVRNLIFNLLILPNFLYSFRIYFKSKDPVIFLFPFIAFLNTLGYGFSYITSYIARTGRCPSE
jgi:glycosyltransferase involved in cell wall biosynthesis